MTIAAELQAMAAAEGPAYPCDRFDGRGIVICAGGARFFTCAWVLIGILRRHLGCTLPIEVWYLGPGEMGPPMRALLGSLDAEPVDAFEVAKIHPASRFDGWELKSYALLHSRFREVMLIDADNVPVADPSFLFDQPEYTGPGALFWPDIVRLGRQNPIWSISGLPFRDAPAFESGQAVIDKSRCWPALSLAHWMNQKAEVLYDVLHGDKDTFLIAWLMRQAPFTLIPHPPRQLEGTLCQAGPDGAVLFQHRASAKWILRGRNPIIPEFRLEEECRGLLGELGERWDGRVFTPPPRSAECREIEANLARRRSFRLTCVGDSQTTIELDGNYWAEQAGRFAYYWHVEPTQDGPVLVLEADGLRRATLMSGSDGAWRGDLLRPPYMPVELLPLSPDPPESVDGGGASAALIEALIDLYTALPWDNETTRDLAGTLRSLARLDPRVIGWFEATASRRGFVATRRALLDAALGAVGAAGERARRVSHRPFSEQHYDRL